MLREELLKKKKKILQYYIKKIINYIYSTLITTTNYSEMCRMSRINHHVFWHKQSLIIRLKLMNTLDPWGRLLAWLLPIKTRRNISGARAANGSDRETFRNIRFIPQFISLNGTNRFSQFNSWFCPGWRTSSTHSC